MKQASTENLTVAIIGGGIGGFATAVALQSKGIKAHVYEQAPALGEIGAGIIIHPPTQHLFNEWGIGEAFGEKASPIKTVELFSAQGEFITNVTGEMLSSLEEDKGGIYPASIHRAQLLDVLISPIDPASIHLGHKLYLLAETEDYVEATFENGEIVRADVVIAANGIHSNIRKMFSDDEPIYSGLHSVRTILSREATKETAKVDATVMYRDGENFLLMQPVANGMHFDIGYSSEDPTWMKEISKEELTAKMATYDDKLVKLLDAIDYPIAARALYFRQPIPQWSTKRITLLGDAAHSMLPTLGQGANSAIADAEVLAQSLSTCTTVEEALQQYENVRKPITTAMQNESQQINTALDLK